ncbi:MAG: GTP-binding protein [Promethearchaeia archaeon]
MSDEYDYLFKSIVVGDGGVGKTALTLRFSKGFFTEDYKMTIGVDFHVKTISIDTDEGPIRCKLQIWDTGGQERFSSIRPMYYRGSLGGLLIFDLTNYESFEHLPMWIEEVRANVKNDIPLLLVGNKSDLADQRAVSIEEINEFTRKFNLYYMETSAKTGEGVGDCFYILACLMVGIGVPEELISKGVAFNPGQISGAAATTGAFEQPATVSEPEIEFAAPPVPEPESLEVSEPEIEFEAPSVPESEPEFDFMAPPVPEPEPIKESEFEDEFIAPPVPEPEPVQKIEVESEHEIEFMAPPVPEPEPIKEPEPEIEFEAPPAPESISSIPKMSEPTEIIEEIEFKTPDEILKEQTVKEDQSKEEILFTPLPPTPEKKEDAIYKPKAVPFSSNIPVPAPPPEDFKPKISEEVSEQKPASVPFVINKRPEPQKPKPIVFPSDQKEVKPEPIKTEESSADLLSSLIPQSTSVEEKPSNSLVDYMPETILSKKEKKKLEKQKKKEAKLKAKLEKEKKIQEAKEKWKKEQEEKKKQKKAKKEKKGKEKKAKIAEPTPTPVIETSPGSLFQTLSSKAEDEPLSKGVFIPFTPKEQSAESTTKLRIIPNVEDIKAETPIMIDGSKQETKEKPKKKQDIVICKQCGAILSSDYAFCNKCGAKL